ncbi:hypothetical protein UFOVP589_43 [uncultured Caudovirales phage]|uniref:Uncharacterized protein n=1 Tax=uncultured Caudovirales phage TaxID=2100421 RepID=A0A6J5MX58_9CAUD|nr:hypothetical protein UFOVP589_43 [uncultured Caudovirales phage]
MTQDFTDDMRAKLIAYLETHDLPSGLGDEESACTLAAIRLAYDGKLNDKVIDCMSPVLGNAAMRLQDAMPDGMRNSARYKNLIPNMPGTGREREAERLAILMDWIWTVVLPQLQPIADKGGYGVEWRHMCEVKTADAAGAAGAAARAARAAADADAADAAGAAADDAYVAARAARAAADADADAAGAAAYDAARAARAAADADADAAGAAAYDAYVAARAARAAADADAAYAAAAYAAAYAAAARAAYAAAAAFWEAVDPIGVLERMTYLEMNNAK